MKINILPGCILAASMVLTTSCSDFLTEDPKGQMTPENVFKTTEDLDLSLTSLYGSLLGLQCNSNTTIVQVMGDDVTSTTGSNKAAYLASDAFEVPSDVKGSEDLWRNLYAIIKNCNYTIDCAKHIGVAETEVSETLGQAYFWRAYAYLMLVRTFGPVPVSPENVLSLSLEETSDATPLTSVEDIYKNIIISDLIKADGFNLPAQYEGDRKSVNGSNIYVSRQAVKSVLVAAYMSMAGYPLHKTECYALAADKAKEAIDIMNQTGANSVLDDWKMFTAMATTTARNAFSGSTTILTQEAGDRTTHSSLLAMCFSITKTGRVGVTSSQSVSSGRIIRKVHVRTPCSESHC